MRNQIKIATIINIVVNIFLFSIKIIVGFLFSSVSLIADAINSFSDIIAAFFIHLCVKINNEKPDDSHQFGHTRAENIAGYTTGILMFFLGISIIEIAIEKILFSEVATYSPYMLVVVGITFVAKLGLYLYIKYVLSKEKSPALKANLQDHLNDMIVIVGVLFAVIGIRAGYSYADPIIGIIIGLFILKSAYDIAKENISYLMGKPASKHLIDEITEKTMSIKAVSKIHLIKSQYLGNKVQVEVHIVLDKRLSLKESHDIGLNVKERIERMDEINNCFVHIDPE